MADCQVHTLLAIGSVALFEKHQNVLCRRIERKSTQLDDGRVTLRIHFVAASKSYKHSELKIQAKDRRKKKIKRVNKIENKNRLLPIIHKPDDFTVKFTLRSISSMNASTYHCYMMPRFCLKWPFK